MDESERWTIPFHVVIWTALVGGLIAVLVVFLLNG
jgi:RsiW-degrading membrane proteinase PrsW (M82 family)